MTVRFLIPEHYEHLGAVKPEQQCAAVVKGFAPKKKSVNDEQIRLINLSANSFLGEFAYLPTINELDGLRSKKIVDIHMDTTKDSQLITTTPPKSQKA
ncbi:hypothetical protein TcasGA2_TC004899 [Tribolium castaneum]|uniref:Uncharacterized protein n=1 Tax=Tribolium castaneum TaxID=7070 RepID=D6WCH7_TRICA|nr:hypothetical protein TcasGA2_TC004899 [Tribolium castaneum]